MTTSASALPAPPLGSPASDTTSPDAGVFDQPARWRAEAAVQLGLRELRAAAAVSPGASFPAALRTIAAQLRAHGCRIVVDLGAGIGGASLWLQHHSAARVIGVEPAEGSREAAAALFPELTMMAGTIEAVPLPSGMADAVTALGVISLVDPLEDALAEIDRILAPAGIVGISDLFLAEGDVERIGPNTFRSVERLRRDLEACGYEIFEVGIGGVEPDPLWGELQQSVDDRVRELHGGDPRLRAWDEDQRHLAGVCDSGRLLAGSVVARRTVSAS